MPSPSPQKLARTSCFPGSHPFLSGAIPFFPVDCYLSCTVYYWYVVSARLIIVSRFHMPRGLAFRFPKHSLLSPASFVLLLISKWINSNR